MTEWRESTPPNDIGKASPVLQWLPDVSGKERFVHVGYHALQRGGSDGEGQEVRLDARTHRRIHAAQDSAGIVLGGLIEGEGEHLFAA